MTQFKKSSCWLQVYQKIKISSLELKKFVKFCIKFTVYKEYVENGGLLKTSVNKVKKYGKDIQI